MRRSSFLWRTHINIFSFFSVTFHAHNFSGSSFFGFSCCIRIFLSNKSTADNFSNLTVCISFLRVKKGKQQTNGTESLCECVVHVNNKVETLK